MNIFSLQWRVITTIIINAMPVKRVVFSMNNSLSFKTIFTPTVIILLLTSCHVIIKWSIPKRSSEKILLTLSNWF